jgi:short-subunit dehydrogenase
MAVGNLPFAAAYMASKRGLAAWSDALRLEYRGRISVTTVYPGYIRTPIHDLAAGRGLSMEGIVPAESLGATVRTIVRACHGRPRRDRASTAMGAVAWSFARHAPGLADRIVAARARRMLRSGKFADSEIAAGAQAHASGRPLTPTGRLER